MLLPSRPQHSRWHSLPQTGTKIPSILLHTLKDLGFLRKKSLLFSNLRQTETLKSSSNSSAVHGSFPSSLEESQSGTRTSGSCSRPISHRSWSMPD